MVVRANEIAV